MTIFGKSRDLKTKTPKTQAACIFLRWNKSQKVECIQMQKLTYGYVEMYFIGKVMTSQKLYDAMTVLAMQITANPYVSFCIWMYSTFRHLFHWRKTQAAWVLGVFVFRPRDLPKYGHDHLKWWQLPIEETWPKSNPRIRRKLKIWRSEVIHSNHFELF